MWCCAGRAEASRGNDPLGVEHGQKLLDIRPQVGVVRARLQRPHPGLQPSCKQRRHGGTFVHEDAHVPCRRGKRERAFQGAQRMGALALRVERQRAQEQDLDHTVDAPAGLSARHQPIQEPQGLAERGTRRVWHPIVMRRRARVRYSGWWR